MSDNSRIACDLNGQVENFVAELTHAVHLLVLQRGRKDSWLDLELELWRVVSDAVKKWERESPRGSEAFVCDCVGVHWESPDGNNRDSLGNRSDALGPFSGE